MESFDADVIVAGAGPAGTSAAFDLASRGISVLILEKSQFPRYKVCGAGLTHKILAEIPYDITPVIETTIRAVRFSHRLDEVFIRKAVDPVMYCTMRDNLDAFMLDKAISAGAKVLFDEHVTGVEQSDSGVEVITKKTRYHSRLVIGADGASGMVARSAGLRRDIEMGIAWEAEIYADARLVKSLAETVFLDWGTLPGGYAWMFPKSGHLSIGVGGPAVLAKRMMGYYSDFLKTIYPVSSSRFPVFGSNYRTSNIEHRTSSIQHPASSIHSWPIPVRRRKGPFHNSRVLVAGDAAGLTDPMTGEGIWYAVKSGRMAAQSCNRFLQGKTANLENYSEQINSVLMDELLEAYRIKNIFNTVPGKIHRLVRDNDRVWRAFGKILRGERNYADVKRGFGKWKFLWGTATKISGWVYFCKEWEKGRKGERGKYEDG